MLHHPIVICSTWVVHQSTWMDLQGGGVEQRQELFWCPPFNDFIELGRMKDDVYLRDYLKDYLSIGRYYLAIVRAERRSPRSSLTGCSD